VYTGEDGSRKSTIITQNRTVTVPNVSLLVLANFTATPNAAPLLVAGGHAGHRPLRGHFDRSAGDDGPRLRPQPPHRGGLNARKRLDARRPVDRVDQDAHDSAPNTCSHGASHAVLLVTCTKNRYGPFERCQAILAPLSTPPGARPLDS
jgi:hypothetical protein